jgi:hypothetical protein
VSGSPDFEPLRCEGLTRIKTDLTDQDGFFLRVLLLELEVKGCGWANWLWEKMVFGFCGDLWLILGL